MISDLSLFNALVIYSVVLLLLSLLCLFTRFLEVGGDSILLAASVLITVRLLLPVEIPIASIVESWDFLGSIQRFFRDNPEVTRSLLVIWAVGAVIAVGRDVYILNRARKTCRSYDVVESPEVSEAAKDLGIPCPVIVSPDVSIPYVAGLLRYTIYFPVWDQSNKRLRMALSHELHHIKAHDAWIKLFFGIVCALMWWNPVVHIFRYVVDALLEFRCDRRVTKPLSPLDRLEYGQMLLDMAKSASKKDRSPALALDESSALGHANTVKQRITILTSRVNKRFRWVVIAIGCVCALVLFCASYLIIYQPASDPSVDNFEVGSDICYHEDFEKLEIGEEPCEAFILEGPDGQYQLFIDGYFVKYLTSEEILSQEYQDLWFFEKEGTK